jgi:putative ABC transport system substrate-binding protein
MYPESHQAILKLARRFCALCMTIIALSSSTSAQESAKMARIGILFVGGRDQPHLESFKQGLRERGYIEGHNLVLDLKYAEGNEERLGSLAAELVRDKADIIVTTASISALAARRITQTIPIVMTSGNPLETGLAQSLAHPGGNVTGLTIMLSDLSGKRLEILKESVPKLNRVAILWTAQNRESKLGFDETSAAAKSFSLHVHSAQIQSADDLQRAFIEIKKARSDGVATILSPLATLNSKRIVELATKHRLPGIYPTRQFAEEGGMMSYGPLIGDLYRRAATYVDKILKGAKPANLPVEQPMKFEFIVNLKAAKQIGLTIPPNVLTRADTVIR